MKKRVMITVDVEAQPPRAPKDHIQRLIYGQFDADSWGIGKMFDIADAHNIAMTCFVDYCGVSAHGPAMLDVGRYIYLRGHDAQLHMHPEYLARDVWQEAGLSPQWNALECDAEQARFLINYIADRHEEATGTAPAAFRGGGFRYNGRILDALAGRGVKYDFSCNAGDRRQAFNQGILAPFGWEPSGIVEIPVGTLASFGGGKGYTIFNFNASCFPVNDKDKALAAFEAYLRRYFQIFPDGIACMVMHSWSFLKLDKDKKYFCEPAPQAPSLFEAFCSHLAASYEVVTARSLAQENFAPRTQRTWRQNQFSIDWPDESPYVCPICAAGEEMLVEGSGIKRRRCRACGSLERHRALARLAQEKRSVLDLNGKRVLHIAPGPCESAILARFPQAMVTSFDKMPDLKTDIVADLSHMPEVASATFDAILLSGIFSHVREFPQALAELWRILADDGVLLQWDFTKTDRETIEYTDLKTITNYYGMEAYNKYGVGRFRYFGELDVDRKFLPWFERDCYNIRDRATGSWQIWNIWRKLPVYADRGQQASARGSAENSYEQIEFWDDEPAVTTARKTDALPIFCIDAANAASFGGDSLYGFALAGGQIIGSGAIQSPLEDIQYGCFGAIVREGRNIRLRCDASGLAGLYCYRSGDCWAVSSSCAKLIEQARSKGWPLTLEAGFAAQMFAACATPLTAGGTLVREIRLLPATTSVLIDVNTGAMQVEDDVAIDLVPALSAAGVDVVDRWASKWIAILRGLARCGLPVFQDITGDRDSRIVLALALAADIDLHAFHFACQDVGDDLRIASQLATALGLRLNGEQPEFHAPDLAGARAIFTCAKKYLHTLGGAPSVGKSWSVRLGGACGEARRGAWRMPLREYAGWLNRRYGEKLRKQALQSLLAAYGEAVDLPAARNFASAEHGMHLLYCLSRRRWHFGHEVFARYFANEFVLAPLADPLLDCLHLQGCVDSDFLFAFILRRFAPVLLDFPFEAGKSLSPAVVAQADALNVWCPYKSAPRDAVEIELSAGCKPFVWPQKPKGEESVKAMLLRQLEQSRKRFDAHFGKEIIADELAGKQRHGQKLEYITAVAEFLEQA